MSYKVQSISNKEKLIELFYFLSRTFYNEDQIAGEPYRYMNERFSEMEIQFEKDKTLLLYVEEDNKIIAGLTMKADGVDKITIGVVAIHENYRGKGLGKLLMQNAEDKCKSKGIKSISLGARLNAIEFYSKMDYNPILMVKVFDFETTENVKTINSSKFQFDIIHEYKGVAYGFVMFAVDKLSREYVQYFNERLDVCDSQYIFVKDL